MCVIIITNPEHPITREELRQAWKTNPDGAGYAYTDKDGAVVFERGFMNFKHYADTVEDLQSTRPLMLHLRISTGAGITPQGTHPYKAGNVLIMKGRTDRPVFAMNGIITGQDLKTKDGARLNDTASYMAAHPAAFKAINPDVLDIIAHDTGARWSAATPDGIITGGAFEDYDGRQYSNLNHLWRYDAGRYLDRLDPYDYESGRKKDGATYAGEVTAREMLKPKLYRRVQKDYELLTETEEYVYHVCNNFICSGCDGCITELRTPKQLNEFLTRNYYILYGKTHGYDY